LTQKLIAFYLLSSFQGTRLHQSFHIVKNFVALLRAALRRAEELLLRICCGAGANLFIKDRNIFLNELLIQN
jgi:hypothetical protein